MANSGVTNMFGDYREGKGDKDDKDGKGDTLDLEAEEKDSQKASSTVEDSWYEEVCKVEERKTEATNPRSSRPSPIKLRISWILSGKVYLEKDMVDPTKKLSDCFRGLGSPHGMRYFIADTAVQVFSHETPWQIFKSYNDKEEFNILDLQCARVSHSR